MSFQSDILAFKRKALEQASLSTSKIVQEYFEQVVIRSPSPSYSPTLDYSIGVLANQWYPEVGGTFNTSVGKDKSPVGIASLARIRASLLTKPFLNKDNIITLTNNLDYAYRAEVLGWPAGQGTNGWTWSKNTGPYAMVRGATQYVIGKYKI